MKAIHLICKREAYGLRLLEAVPGGRYRSGCWDLQNADDLIGGWIYLHPDGKKEPSQFGGIIEAIENCEAPDDAAHKTRKAFIFIPHFGGVGQKWRGASHGMAWNSGLVEALLPHEVV